MKEFITTIFLAVTLMNCVAAASEPNEAALVDNLVKLERYLEPAYIAEWGDHWATIDRIEQIENEIKQAENLARIQKDVEKNILYSRAVEELLMGMIVKGKHREISTSGCNVVDLHGSVSQHIRQLKNLMACAENQGISCGPPLRILSANADRAKGTIRRCTAILRRPSTVPAS